MDEELNKLLALIILDYESSRKKDDQLVQKINDQKQLLREAAIKNGVEFKDTFPHEVQIRKYTRLFRRLLRNKLFRIVEGKWKENKELEAIKSWFDRQFHSGFSWNSFTFEWDVSAIEPLKLITPLEWDGAIIDNFGNKVADPPAFTKQEV